ncbi:MAG: hypothetical protein EZS28_022620 [Streblomastix strix]|uniref:Uncharacterized protein n=1 Tax=Streblomastix strix TaxID=222440 RepID=A0A5J4VHD4_9EUKA|nr:MAG: hypothetical protein EZS28_022620 [Streblomastix strix]
MVCSQAEDWVIHAQAVELFSAQKIAQILNRIQTSIFGNQSKSTVELGIAFMTADPSNEKRCISRSISSESSQGNEQRLGPNFQLLEVIITVLQCIAITFQRNDWPMSGQFYQIFEDVFRWLTFSISWNSISFMIVMLILYGAFAVGVIVVIIICVLINKKGTMQISIIGSVLNIIVSLLTEIFYLPAVNVFFCSFNCIVKAGQSYFIVTKKCYNSFDKILLVFGMFLFVIYFVFTFLMRLFIFELEAKKGILTTLLPIVGIILRSQQAAIAGIGIAISFLLTIHPIGLQPYFSPLGNTIWASAMMIGIPLIIGLLTYKRARSLWAVREDEEIPLLQSKKNQFTSSRTPRISSAINRSPSAVQSSYANNLSPDINIGLNTGISNPQLTNKISPVVLSANSQIQ